MALLVNLFGFGRVWGLLFVVFFLVREGDGFVFLCLCGFLGGFGWGMLLM